MICICSLFVLFLDTSSRPCSGHAEGKSLDLGMILETLSHIKELTE